MPSTSAKDARSQEVAHDDEHGLARPEDGAWPGPRATRGRLTQLDGLRFIAIAAVFLHHSLDIPMLWVGVDLFFVLSGYLITAILLKLRSQPGYFRVFYYRRFLRIFPPYYVFLAITFLAMSNASSSLVPWYVLYLNNFNDAFQFHYAPISLVRMWSLAIEEQFYLVWPLVVLWTPSRRLGQLCLALVVLTPLFRVAVCEAFDNYRPGYYLMFSRVDLLALGALLTVFEQQGHWVMRRGLWTWTALGATALGVFVVLAALRPDFRAGINSPLFNGLGYSLIALGMVSAVAIVVQLSTGYLLRFLQWKPIAFLGMISYTMYLYHTLAIQWANGLLGRGVAGALLAASVTILIGVFSWYVFESPLQRFKDVRFRR